MAVSSRGPGRVVLSHQTGVRIPVPLLLLHRRDAEYAELKQKNKNFVLTLRTRRLCGKNQARLSMDT